MNFYNFARKFFEMTEQTGWGKRQIVEQLDRLYIQWLEEKAKAVGGGEA